MRRGYGCDPHNTQSALRDHKHEFVGKTFFFYFNTCVTFSVRLQTRNIENNIAEKMPFNSETTILLFVYCSSSDPMMTHSEGGLILFF